MTVKDYLSSDVLTKKKIMKLDIMLKSNLNKNFYFFWVKKLKKFAMKEKWGR